MTKSKNFFQSLLKPFTSSYRDQQEDELEKIAAREQKAFSFEALVAATKNFHASHKLGEGGFGPVYQHKNVVNLLGYFARDPEKLLVYEYIENQSLDKFLFKSNKRELLDWKRRHNIIAGVAKGLLYLHEQAHCTIIHRDIKASNILLDDQWVPKIADFGMARLFPEGETHVQTRIAGNNGYMAPEYLMHGNLSKKADVFSFGVSSFDRDPNSGNLIEWAYKLYKKQRSLEIIGSSNSLIGRHGATNNAGTNRLAMRTIRSKITPDNGPRSSPTIQTTQPSPRTDPTRPGILGSRQRRHRTTTTSSANSDGSSLGSFHLQLHLRQFHG